jgi:pyrroloquinoline quinone (PQQ) biosynthesis protein C
MNEQAKAVKKFLYEQLKAEIEKEGEKIIEAMMQGKEPDQSYLRALQAEFLPLWTIFN